MDADFIGPDPAGGEFSSEATAAALVGTWRYAAKEEPSGIGYLHFTEDGRVFYFVVHNPQQPEKRLPVRLWYSVESSSALRLRAKGRPDGWLYDYHLKGDSLTLGREPQHVFACSRADPEEIPGWFRDGLARMLVVPQSPEPQFRQ